jgi:hypothetical protein
LEQNSIAKLSSGLSVTPETKHAGRHRKRQTFRHTLFNKYNDIGRRIFGTPGKKIFHRTFFNNINDFVAGIFPPLKGDIKLSVEEKSQTLWLHHHHL